MNIHDTIRSACAMKNWKFDAKGADEFLVHVSTDEGRQQDVSVSAYEEDGERLVVFKSDIGPALGLMDDKPMLTLKMNYEFRHGALAIDEHDRLVMVEKIPQDKLDAGVTASIIRYLARRGDMIEKYVFENS